MSDNLAERINSWVTDALVASEVINFFWEWDQATKRCDSEGCLADPCPRCGR